MYQKMKAYIQEYHMLQEQDKVRPGLHMPSFHAA